VQSLFSRKSRVSVVVLENGVKLDGLETRTQKTTPSALYLQLLSYIKSNVRYGVGRHLSTSGRTSNLAVSGSVAIIERLQGCGDAEDTIVLPISMIDGRRKLSPFCPKDSSEFLFGNK
jgi:hypothetical protein